MAERFGTLIYSPRPAVSRLSLATVLILGALVAMLLVAIAGPIYAVAGFLALVGGLLALKSLSWGYVALFAVIGLLPFAALPVKLGFTPTFLDLAVLLLALVWVLRVATRRQEELVVTPLGVPVLVFLLLAIFAFANGLRFSAPTATSVRNFAELALAILLFFLLVNNLRTAGDVAFVARLAMWSGAAGAAIAVVFYVIPAAWTVRILDSLARLNYPGGYGALRYIEDDPANPMRAIGTQVDPNVLGGFLILVAMLTAPQLVAARRIIGWRWASACFGVELLALYLTHSRGSMVGLAAGLVALGLLRYRKLLLIALVGAAALLILPPAQAYVLHFLEGIQLQDQATLMRLGEYRDAITLILRYPLFGVGFTGSPDADLYVGVSNLYLLMAEEMGVVGVAWFLVIIGLFFANLLLAVRRARDGVLEPLLLGLVAAVAAAMVGGVFDHYLFNLVYPHMSTLFWVYLGLGMAAVQLAPSAPPERIAGAPALAVRP